MSTILKCKVDLSSKYTWDRPGGTSGIYADGLEINPILFNKKKLEIVGNITNGEYNLAIHNVSENEEGIYKCYQINNQRMTAKETYVTLTIIGKLKLLP